MLRSQFEINVELEGKKFPLMCKVAGCFKCALLGAVSDPGLHALRNHPVTRWIRLHSTKAHCGLPQSQSFASTGESNLFRRPVFLFAPIPPEGVAKDPDTPHLLGSLRWNKTRFLETQSSLNQTWCLLRQWRASRHWVGIQGWANFEHAQCTDSTLEVIGNPIGDVL